ncbi:toprim domain-containing protein [Ktedonospora formicarum]|uniref:Toprim domain-containing protein n=1 Tax=Ktedonospora formicarum TaxID=2778364 RepID=A0A8J3MT05_9CHLR|nr:toprim domain-containing protein [Ktedonospora formicarum]GHO45148.1 hypothetical protein KSX_33110 [Ktedonospora formicarum]
MARYDIKTVDIRRAALPEGAIPPYGTNPLLIKCPKHQDDSESLAIYPDHIHCMGCPFRIQKRMDALAFLLKLPSWKEALAVAPKYKFLTETERQAAKQKEKPRRAPTMRDVEIYEGILSDICADRIEWFHSRGLSDETIRTARLGHNGAAFVIPVFDAKLNVVTLRYRNDEEICGRYEDEWEGDELVKAKKIPKYRGWTGCNEATLYPAWKFERDRSDYVVLVEGELDALLLWQHGVPAVTATNGAKKQGLVLDLLSAFFQRIGHLARRRPSLRRVVICGDRDEPGIVAARKLFERAKQEYAEVVWLQWPAELGKDISEVMQKGYTFEQIYEQYGFDEESTPSESSTGSAGHDAPTSSAEATDTKTDGNVSEQISPSPRRAYPGGLYSREYLPLAS